MARRLQISWIHLLVVSQFVLPQKYENIRNSYSNMFIVLGALKSLLSFPLDIDVNDISNSRTNYLLLKCRKKAIANKQNRLNTHLLIATFHQIAIKYESELKIQFILLDDSTNHNVGSLRSLHLRCCPLRCLLCRLRCLLCYKGFPFMRLVAQL